MATDKIQFLIGFILGLMACSLGVMAFLHFIAEVEITESAVFLKTQKSFGKVISIGCVLNLALFFALLKLKKEFMAKGVIMSVIALAIMSLFL